MSSKVERSRLRLLAGIGLAAGASSVVYKHIGNSSSTAPESNQLVALDAKQISGGYPVKLDSQGNETGAGWAVNPGDTLALKLSGEASKKVEGGLVVTDIYDNQVLSIGDVVLENQDFANDQPWEYGAGYSTTATFKVPENFPSGVYFICAHKDIFFVVRSKVSSNSKKVSILISTNTFNAYSDTNGRGMYGDVKIGRASFLRPLSGVKNREWLPTLQWLHKYQPFAEEVEIAYLIDQDLENEDVLLGTKLLVLLGHSEYWTRKARENYDGYVSAGGNSIIAGGNTMWWQTRYDENDKSLMVCYKGSTKKEDPLYGTRDMTLNWHRESLAYPIYKSIGSDFHHGGFGASRRDKALGWDGCVVTNQDNPLFSGTGLKNGELFRLFKVAEYDGPPILGFSENGFPVVDEDKIGAHKFELLGFDLGYRAGLTVGSWHVMQPEPSSGIIFNIGAMPISRLLKNSESSRYSYLKSDAEILKIILSNAFRELIDGRDVFSANREQPGKVKWHIKTPYKDQLPDDFYWLQQKPKHFKGAG